MQTQPDREDLHFLLDRIPDSDVATAGKILRALADPMLKSDAPAKRQEASR